MRYSGWSGASILFVIAFALVTTGCVNSSFKSLFRSTEASQPPSIPLTVWHESFEIAQDESRSTGKPILADFTGSDWCHWCVKLKNDVFETDTFKEWASDNVVLLELDYPRRSQQDSDIKQQNMELAQQFGIESYPTVLLIDTDGNVIGKLGYMDNPSDWIAAAESHLQDSREPGFSEPN